MKNHDKTIVDLHGMEVSQTIYQVDFASHHRKQGEDFHWQGEREQFESVRGKKNF